MADVLQTIPSINLQTSVESITYTLDVSNGPGTTTPSSVSVTAITIADNTDATTTVFPTNSPSTSSNVITLSPLTNLTAGNTYHVRVQYSRGDDVFQPYAIVHCPY